MNKIFLEEDGGLVSMGERVPGNSSARPEEFDGRGRSGRLRKEDSTSLPMGERSPILKYKPSILIPVTVDDDGSVAPFSKIAKAVY